MFFSPNLAWRDEPLKERLESAVDLPVMIENDANAAAWGEFRFGAAAEVDDVVMVTVGTGIGGGVVVDGVLMRGAFGVAAELGHMRVVPDGLRCGCGNRGCWEQYASGSALVREARELVASGTPHAARLSELCAGDPAALTGPDVTRAAAEGDPAAVELLADLGTWIGEGAASVAAILDPALIVLGGGVSDAGALLLDPARAAFRRQLTGRGYRPEARFALASLGNDAGMIGAADLAARVSQRLAIGIDIGGTKVAGGVVDADGNITHRARRDTPHRSTSPSVVEDTIVDVVDELMKVVGSEAVAAVGIGAAGFVAADRATVVFAPHLSWRHEPLQETLQKRVAVPISVDNDANAAVWAEWKFGAAQGETHVMMITLGTGIGGGILVNGQVQRGRFGIAGEFGHMQVVPGGHRCECGNRGCWEQYASGNALVREARSLVSADSPIARDLLDRVEGVGQPDRATDHGGCARWRPDVS